MITQEQLKAKEDSDKSKGFDSFMARPTTRLLLSMIPAGEHQDALRTLLREAFDTGWGHGSGSMLGIMLEQVMRGPQRAP